MADSGYKITKQPLVKLIYRDDYDRKIYPGSEFGALASPRTKPHAGVDYGSDLNEKLYAIEDGEITAVRTGIAQVKKSYGDNRDYGNYFLHYIPKWDITVLGAHSTPVVAKGPVKKGQYLGYIASSGLSTGPHLHWGYAEGRHDDLNKFNIVAKDFETFKPGEKVKDIKAFKFDRTVNIRTSPTTKENNKRNVQYYKGEVLDVIIDLVEADGYQWGKYVSGSGITSYVALKELKTGVLYGEFINKSEAPKPIQHIDKGAGLKTVKESATFTPDRVIIYRDYPSTSQGVNMGTVKSGQKIPYTEYYQGGGYVWIKWKQSNQTFYIPIREYKNSKYGLKWGKIS